MEPPFAEHSKEKLHLCQHSPLPSVAAPFRVRLPAGRQAIFAPVAPERLSLMPCTGI